MECNLMITMMRSFSPLKSVINQPPNLFHKEQHVEKVAVHKEKKVSHNPMRSTK